MGREDVAIIMCWTTGEGTGEKFKGGVGKGGNPSTSNHRLERARRDQKKRSAGQG